MSLNFFGTDNGRGKYMLIVSNVLTDTGYPWNTAVIIKPDLSNFPEHINRIYSESTTSSMSSEFGWQHP